MVFIFTHQSTKLPFLKNLNKYQKNEGVDKKTVTNRKLYESHKFGFTLPENANQNFAYVTKVLTIANLRPTLSKFSVAWDRN